MPPGGCGNKKTLRGRGDAAPAAVRMVHGGSRPGGGFPGNATHRLTAPTHGDPPPALQAGQLVMSFVANRRAAISQNTVAYAIAESTPAAMFVQSISVAMKSTHEYA